MIAEEATAAVLRDLFDLRGTRAVVTGAASGLGLASARSSPTAAPR